MAHTVAQVLAGHIEEAWTPVFIFDCTDNAGVTYYWARQAVTWTNPYTATVLDHSPLPIDMGAFGIPQVPEIKLALNNADVSLAAICEISNFVGATITPRLIFVNPLDGEVTTDSICFGIFVADAPSNYYPRVEFTAWNRLNFARRSLPLSTVTQYDRYPFPSTAAERHQAHEHPESQWYASGYSPDDLIGNYAITATVTTAGTGANVLVVAGEDYDTTVPEGLEVYLIDGAGAGQYRKVASKTATTLVPESAFNPAPSAGDSFRAYYTSDSYNATRDVDVAGVSVGLETIGLSVRFGGCISKAPPTIAYSPKRGETDQFKGSANDAQAGRPIPLCFGTVRTTPMCLISGAIPSWSGIGGAIRTSFLLLCDGVNFDDLHDGASGIGAATAVQRVLLPGVKDGQDYEVPGVPSVDSAITGGWTVRQGYFGSGSQVPPYDTKYRNRDDATDFPLIGGHDIEFHDRELFSGLAWIRVDLPNELAAGTSGMPKTEVIFKGMWIEHWHDGGINHDWSWSDNPVWILWHLLKMLGWPIAQVDEDAVYHAADYCDTALANGKKRFRCNLRLEDKTRVIDVIRGICSNARLYFTYNSSGQLQIKVQKTFAEEGSAFALGTTNILRGQDGRLLVKKWSKSVQQLANVYSINFQDEDCDYIQNTESRSDLESIARMGQVDGDSLTTILGIPSRDQAVRILNWIKTENLDANEWYTVRTSIALLSAQVGQVGTITDVQNSLAAQQCRLRTWTLNPDGTVDLVLQKHVDAGYTDDNTVSPLIRASSDSTYSPRSAGGVSGDPGELTGNPTLTELFIQDDTSPDVYHRAIRANFSVPPTTYATFTARTVISALAVQTAVGSIPDDQYLYVEVCPQIGGVDGLPSNYLLANIPAGGTDQNKFTFTLQLPAEATHYVVRIGQYPGKLYKHSTVANGSGATPFTVTITDVSTLDSSSLSPDPGFDHIRIFYYYDSTPNELRDGGRTQAPTQTAITFTPEPPLSDDVSITVIVCSANVPESDFFPLDASPRTTLALTKDSGNPAGASGLTVLTTYDDPSIPLGYAAFQFNRDTTNWKSISGVEIVLSSAAVCEGPFEAERNGGAPGVGGNVIEVGTCTVTAGDVNVTVTRAADADAVSRVLVIYTADGTPDSDLDGNVILTQGLDSLTLTSPFSKSGTFSYAIVKRWWDPTDSTNLTYLWFPTGQIIDPTQPVWRTQPVHLTTMSFYARACSRNPFGVGERIVTAAAILVSSGEPLNILEFQADNSGAVAADTAFADWVDAAAAGSTVEMKSGTYKFTAPLLIDKALTILADGAIFNFVTANSGGIEITASDVDIKGAIVQGPQYALSHAAETAFYIHGATAAAPVTGIKITNTKILNWGDAAIEMEFVQDFTIHQNEISDCYYAGVLGFSVSDGVVTENNIQNIVGAGNAYGIAITREALDIADYPRSKNVVVANNTIRDIPNWEGIDTHAGEKISIIGNVISHVLYPISVGPSSDDYAALDCTVENNILDSEVTDGSYGAGIIFVGSRSGAATVNASTGTIVGNIIKGHGYSDARESTGGILISDAIGVPIVGNRIVECCIRGILLNQNVNDGLIVGNTIVDPWSLTASYASPRGIEVAVTSRAHIAGNYISRGTRTTGAGETTFTYGVVIANSVNVVYMGPNISYGHATAAFLDSRAAPTSDVCSGTLGMDGFTVKAAGLFKIDTRAVIGSDQTGSVWLTNWAGTGFQRLVLGQLAAATPSIFPSGSDLEFKKADGSAYSSGYFANLYPQPDNNRTLGNSASRWQSAFISSAIVFGVVANSSTSGNIRLENGAAGILARNNAATGDFLLIAPAGDAGDTILIGKHDHSGVTKGGAIPVASVTGAASKANPAIVAATIPLAKITGGGADGSITVNAEGIITAYTAPT